MTDDWRALERARVAAGGVVGHTWTCNHALGDRSHIYNGVGLRTNGASNKRQLFVKNAAHSLTDRLSQRDGWVVIR